MAKKSKEEKKSKKRKLEEIQPQDEEQEPEEVEEEEQPEVMEVEEDSEPEQEEIEPESENESETEEPQLQVRGSGWPGDWLQQHESRSRHDPFREYYMSIITEEFGDDLDTLRKVCQFLAMVNIQDKSFNEKLSLPILIRALEQGQNIFDPEERKLILEQRASQSKNQ